MSPDRDLQNMYRQTVLEHSRNPRNFRRLEQPDRLAEGFNPLCGDKITVYLDLREQTIDTIAFEGTGCAISLASASMMMEAVQGRPLDEVRALIGKAQTMFGSEADTPVETDIDGLDALGGVRAYPSRVKCATLAWKTLEAALSGESGSITTE